MLGLAVSKCYVLEAVFLSVCHCLLFKARETVWLILDSTPSQHMQDAKTGWTLSLRLASDVMKFVMECLILSFFEERPSYGDDKHY